MYIVIMILLVSVLILVHEFGHYLAARMCGVMVPRFGFGLPIGPSVKLFRFNKTDFYLHAFLFGGYVLFPDDIQKDENKEDKDKDAKKEADEIEMPQDPKELYCNKTISQKLFIVSAGVLMNALFAILLVIFCAAFFGKLPASTQNIYVGGFTKDALSNIGTLGIKEGDKIIKINGKDLKTYYQLTLYINNSRLFDGYAPERLVEQNIKELKHLNPEIQDVIPKGQTIILPEKIRENSLELNKNVVRGLERYKKEGKELTQSQIELRGDIYGLKSYTADRNISLQDVALALSDTFKPLSVTVLRGNQEITFNNIEIGTRGLLGLNLRVEEVYNSTKTPRDIIVKSLGYLYDTTTSMLLSLWNMFSGKVNASDMHGVIAIVKVGGDVIASKGMLNGLLLTAMISINLAILNILPIPALDGGHVLFLTIEKLTGRKPSEELSEKLNNFFFTLLIILLLLVCYNDIYALITKQF